MRVDPNPATNYFHRRPNGGSKFLAFAASAAVLSGTFLKLPDIARIAEYRAMVENAKANGVKFYSATAPVDTGQITLDGLPIYSCKVTVDGITKTQYSVLMPDGEFITHFVYGKEQKPPTDLAFSDRLPPTPGEIRNGILYAQFEDAPAPPVNEVKDLIAPPPSILESNEKLIAGARE